MVKTCEPLSLGLIALLIVPAPCLHASSLILHHTSFDGGLYWTCPIARLQIGSNLRIDITLCHDTKHDSFENSVFSRWRIAGLETYIMRDNEGNIVWCSPTGQKETFKVKMLNDHGIIDGKNCKLAVVSEDDYVIIDQIQRRWKYSRGSLSSVIMAGGEEISFLYSNGLIREIRRKETVIFHTMQEGSALILSDGARSIAAIHYDQTGQLIESIIFGNEKRQPLKFIYEGCILQAITEGDKRIYEFIWKKVDFIHKWFSTLMFPLYLYSDGQRKYQHEFSFGIARIISASLSGRKDEKILNLKTGTIIDRSQKTSQK